MQSLKTGFVVVLLAAMLYGVYVVVNTPPARTPKAVQEHLAESDSMLEIEEGGGDEPVVEETAPRRPLDRIARNKDAASKRSARELKADESQDDESPAVPTFDPSAAREAAADAPSGEDAASDRALAELADGRRPVGLESSERAPPPSPPGPDALAPVPIPDLKQPSDDAAAAAATPFANESPGVPAPMPPDGSSFTSAPAGVDPAETEPTPEATPTPEGSPSTEAPATPEDRSSFNGGETAAPDAATPSDSASTPREGVRFDPKEAVFQRSWKEAQQELALDRPKQALLILSMLYADPRLNVQERKALHDALDPLAAQVIYSPEHLLDQPYEVRKGDTLPSIAEKYRVPWQLLANINGVKDPTFLLPGTKLKVMRGPFKAEVDLTAQELILYWNQLYAGRFPISTGVEPPPAPGEFEVKTKSPGRDYTGANGPAIPAGDASNPYGNVFLDLGRNLAIHGSATTEGGSTAGCISLSPRDAEDVYGILSVGSTVIIRR
ncbi:MAG: LysM peptidoglycan-binding domain-containing protein [Pirellulales bacterium]